LFDGYPSSDSTEGGGSKLSEVEGSIDILLQRNEAAKITFDARMSSDSTARCSHGSDSRRPSVTPSSAVVDRSRVAGITPSPSY
jgi:hypothetical protein